jgi:nitrogen fixation NifU-like protein
VSGRFGSVMDHFQDPQNRGRLETPDRVGQAGSQGTFGTVMITLRLDGEIVADARHESYGCGYTIACGSMLTEWAIRRHVGDCLALSADEFAADIEGLPPYKRHCPGLVVAALHAALDTSPES